MVIISRLNGSDGTNLKVTSNLKQEINIIIDKMTAAIWHGKVQVLRGHTCTSSYTGNLGPTD